MPPTLAEVIDRFITNRLRGEGQGVLLRRLGEKRFQVGYCCLFSQQEHRLGPRLLQVVPTLYKFMMGGCFRPAGTRRACNCQNSRAFCM